MRVQQLGIICLVFILSWSGSLYARDSADDPVGIRTLCNQYIETWKKFYPSRAFSRGFLDSIFKFEDYSQENIDKWVAFNKKSLDHIVTQLAKLDIDDRIDARLLKTQIHSEIDRWEIERPHNNLPTFYARTISPAVRRVLNSELLMPEEKAKLIQARLKAVDKLCVSAITQLKTGNPDIISSALNSLLRSAEYIGEKLPALTKNWPAIKSYDTFPAQCAYTTSQIQKLITFIEKNISPPPGQTAPASANLILGCKRFTRKLQLATDSDLTPEKLSTMALEEIHTVRKLMTDASTAYLTKTYPHIRLPNDQNTLINLALKDMEKSHPTSEQGYLQFWKDLSKRAENFIRNHRIATIPAEQSLSIILAPESAGPSARIGWVSSAPPFHPNPWTTIYLPTIPDSFPEKERKEFWRSFNNYFTRFIVIHELFPGHYIQSKINRENPHPVRRLFPYALYSEGWATLCEKVALDAGWDDQHKLTRLAQLRKRLENANRAYTSVQVHCNNWDPFLVNKFSLETSLLAPQFAKSLWGRLMSSPIQITTYFLGTQQFTALWENEKKRQGDKFSTLEFMDTILRAGPIPLDEFQEIFKKRHSER